MIHKFGVEKDTSDDKISVKLIKRSNSSVVKPVTDMIFFSIETCSFPG